jgi:hypothetical protein
MQSNIKFRYDLSNLSISLNTRNDRLFAQGRGLTSGDFPHARQSVIAGAWNAMKEWMDKASAVDLRPVLMRFRGGSGVRKSEDCPHKSQGGLKRY